LTQVQIAVLLLKIGLVSGFTSILAWAVVYTVLTRGRVWLNPIGRSLIRFALLIAALLVPFTLSLFFSLTRLDSRIVLWVDVVLVAAVSVEMMTRILVWVRESRGTEAGEPSSPDGEQQEVAGG
jgi:hypothetical protein